ncbi:MAG: phosphatidylserine decarboxylase, partial [Epsilonproteobacteria bacterium]|nr:phosphatidylserine decarboxylase [Campylobacterota bacterium]
HVPGLLYPVNLKWLRKIPSLFIENERVILECKMQNDELFYMVFIGALNVGKMRFIFDDRIQTNSNKRFTTYYKYGDISLKKGDNLGTFEMGSTIVMFFEKDCVNLLCQPDKHIKYADTIAVINEAKSD